MDITSPTTDHTAKFQELTEEEFETLQPTDAELTTPSNSCLSKNVCTPHQFTHNMQPVSLFNDNS